MTDTSNTGANQRKGQTKYWVIFFAALFSSYLMTQASLRGVDFQTVGVSSEEVKSMLIATIVTISAKLSPTSLRRSSVDLILFIRGWYKDCQDAQNKQLTKRELNEKDS